MVDRILAVAGNNSTLEKIQTAKELVSETISGLTKIYNLDGSSDSKPVAHTKEAVQVDDK